MDARLKDRVAVITGAGSGIGRAVALKFARYGARVVAGDIQSNGVDEEINKQHDGEHAVFVKCDVSKESEVANLVQKAVEFGGRLDIMCNFAGISGSSQMQKRAHEMDTELLEKVLSINVRGLWLCCKYATKQMLEQEPRGPNARGDRTRGWIVNAASVFGLVAFREMNLYVTSKHAVVGMTKAMAEDYAKDRIHINCVNPGCIDSPFTRQDLADPEAADSVINLHPWGDIGKPDDVADATVFLASDEAAWITGTSLVVDGGYTCR